MSVAKGSLGTNKRRGNRLQALFPLSVLFILAAIGLFIFELVTFSQREDALQSGLTVAGVDVSGLSQRDAVAKWEQALAQPITLYYNDSPIILNPDTVGFRPSSAAMLAEAESVSERDNGFWQRFINYLLGQEAIQEYNVPLIANYQTNLLRNFLQDIANRYDNPPGPAGYDTLTLTTFPGTAGYALDIEAALQMIDTALKDANNRSVILPVTSVAAPNPSLETLQDLIIAYLDSRGFIYDGQTTVASIFILDLQTGEEININGDVAFSAASTMKVPILIDFYRTLTFTPSPEEAWLMANSLLCSNNSSSNLIMQIIGGNDLFRGIASVTQTAQYLGARNTYITAPFFLGIEGQQLGSIPAPATNPNPNFNTNPDPFNQTTAEDLGTLFNLIYDCAQFNSGLATAYPNGEITQRECRQMLELMSANDLLRLLQGGLPPNTRISHKNGWVFDTVGDAGVVFPSNGRNYVISVFLWEQTEFQDYEKLWPIVEEISRAAWNYFSPEAALINARNDLPITAQACEGNYLPPSPAQVNLDDINAWRSQ